LPSRSHNISSRTIFPFDAIIVELFTFAGSAAKSGSRLLAAGAAKSANSREQDGAQEWPSKKVDAQHDGGNLSRVVQHWLIP
jgi:hypothetical protein